MYTNLYISLKVLTLSKGSTRKLRPERVFLVERAQSARRWDAIYDLGKAPLAAARKTGAGWFLGLRLGSGRRGSPS